MDIATIIGLILGVGLILGAIMLGGGGFGAFIDPPSLMIVVGGSIAAILINFPLKSALSIFGVVMKCFLTKLPTPQSVIDQFREFATVVRREGLLALEGSMETVDDPFLRRGLEMVVGGSSKEELMDSLETELSAVQTRHGNGKKLVDGVGAAAPAFGMIGTLIGLVQMLQSLDDPSKIGGGMAVALLTTLYGAVVANLFCLPLAGKLDARATEETMIRELMISGMVALVEGMAPRAVDERLQAFVSPKQRSSGEEKKAA